MSITKRNKITISSSDTNGIAFCLYGTLPDNSESSRYILKSPKTITEATIISSTAPSSAITVQIFKNNVQIGSNISHSTTLTTSTLSSNLVSGDILYVKISGSSNGITNITVEVTVI
jgi:hypothetical protein